MICPLCKSDQVHIISVLHKNALAQAYKKILGIDVTRLINRCIGYYVCRKCALRFYDPPITGDEDFYNALQKYEWYYMDEKHEYTEAIKYIFENDYVLDVGSGKGAFAKCIATKNYVGLDMSVHARDMAAKNGIEVVNEDVQKYAQENEKKFDVVVSFQVLEHIANPENFLAAKVRALKIGGKMIIAVPSDSSFLRYVNNGALNMPPHHVTRWNDQALAYIAQKYDLELVTLHHEKLQNAHKVWYLSTVIQNAMIKTKFLDMSVTRSIISFFSNVIALFISRGLRKEFLPDGHTVIAIYKKNENSHC